MILTIILIIPFVAELGKYYVIPRKFAALKAQALKYREMGLKDKDLTEKECGKRIL